ncbi:MAG: DUF6644 family protein [Steroidobacteraceae bacterium]
MIEQICIWLQETWLGMQVSEKYFPLIESIHVIGLAGVFGSIAVVDFRLLGLANKRLSITYLNNQVLPWTWRFFTVAAVTGLLMFIGNATTYYENTPFRVKIVLLVLVGVNMAIFQFGTFKNVSAWDTGKPAGGARFAGAMSLLLWTGIVGFGRWIGFV